MPVIARVLSKAGGEVVQALGPNAMRGECRWAVRLAQLPSSPPSRGRTSAPALAIFLGRPWLQCTGTINNAQAGEDREEALDYVFARVLLSESCLQDGCE